MKKHLLCIAVLFFLPLLVSAQVITTIAGNGTAGYSGDNGPALSAQIHSAIGITIGTHGDVYIAEYANNCIRRISPKGIITTVAGNGIGADKEMAGTGVLTGPVGVAVSSNGDIYIADYGVSCIRRLDHINGIMTTITCSSVSNPSGLAMDKNDNLYIADQSNNRICRIGPKGEFSVVAEGLSQPSGVAVDNKGNVYASSWSANVVWKINSDRKVDVIVGTGNAGYSGDGGQAIKASLNQPYSIAVGQHNDLYIADDANCRIRRLDMNTGIITTIAGKKGRGYSGDGGPAGKARIDGPAGIAVSATGDIYFTDENNQCVRKITLNVK